MENPGQYLIDIVFSPSGNYLQLDHRPVAAVVIDVLRASTTICSMFMNGVSEVIPVSSEEEALKYQKQGFIIAGEREGVRAGFAVFGNSPLEFNENIRGKSIAMITTNGTKAIDFAKGADLLAVGCFSNISALSSLLSGKGMNISLVCAGWHGMFSLEDALCAGAFVEKLSEKMRLLPTDAALAMLALWQKTKNDYAGYLKNGSHYKRLIRLGFSEDFDFAMKMDACNAVPLLEENYLKKYQSI
ncbi:MAG: 2-phosphosulfolactate phosphatase [Bacteroidales bacterium]|nr:2-phosphosulfolactate phosphatase [Bacteroidales bacterium]